MVATIDQIKNFTTTLADYFRLLSENLATPTDPVPSFEDYIEAISVPNVLEDSIASENRSSSFATGALTDTVHRADAVKREMNIRTKTKGSYFSDAVTDIGAQVEFTTTLYAKYLNYLRRTTPEQAPT